MEDDSDSTPKGIEVGVEGRHVEVVVEEDAPRHPR